MTIQAPQNQRKPYQQVCLFFLYYPACSQLKLEVLFHHTPHSTAVFKFITDRFSRFIVSVQTHPLISETTQGESPVASNLAAAVAADSQEPYQYYDSPQNSRVEELWGNSSARN
jgi:hypothetical protein